MTDRPILFSGPMVRAILEGRKTQTRRVLKHRHIDIGIAPTAQTDHPIWIGFDHPKGGPLTCVKWPYAIGDRLWVREAFTLTQHGTAVYRSDATDETGQRWQSIAAGDPEREVLWKPSIHMPRAKSRLTLTVTDVRVQRLQEIREEDAEAEGVEVTPCGEKDGYLVPARSARENFRDLWDGLNADRGFGWKENPWVAAITFTVEKRNIDS